MQIIKDMISFVKTLTFADVMFFLAVLSLMLLIITLIYFLLENKEETEEVEETKLEKKPIIIENKIEPEQAKIKEITEALNNKEPLAINLNKYEEEQEQKAIISYEELLKRKNDFALNYSEEEQLDDNLSIKKVDLKDMLNKDVEEHTSFHVEVISYDKEEAFLKALKALQEKIN